MEALYKAAASIFLAPYFRSGREKYFDPAKVAEKYKIYLLILYIYI